MLANFIWYSATSETSSFSHSKFISRWFLWLKLLSIFCHGQKNWLCYVFSDDVVFGHCSRNLSIGEDVAGIGLSGIDWYRLSIGACPRHRSTVKVNNGFSQKITWISGYNAIHQIKDIINHRRGVTGQIIMFPLNSFTRCNHNSGFTSKRYMTELVSSDHPKANSCHVTIEKEYYWSTCFIGESIIFVIFWQL